MLPLIMPSGDQLRPETSRAIGDKTCVVELSQPCKILVGATCQSASPKLGRQLSTTTTFVDLGHTEYILLVLESRLPAFDKFLIIAYKLSSPI